MLAWQISRFSFIVDYVILWYINAIDGPFVFGEVVLCDFFLPFAYYTFKDSYVMIIILFSVIENAMWYRALNWMVEVWSGD